MQFLYKATEMSVKGMPDEPTTLSLWLTTPAVCDQTLSFFSITIKRFLANFLAFVTSQGKMGMENMIQVESQIMIQDI